MSKLKSALLISVALSPIFVSATRGIEVVHAEVVQKAVAQQIKKAAEAKPAQKTDEKKSADTKANTVTATKQDDSGTTDSKKADSDVKKSEIIAFDDKKFQQKFQETDYYKKQVVMYGENKPSTDAKLATDSAGYIATIIGEKFIESINKPTILKALGFAGPLGSLLSFLIDLFTPAARNKTDEKLAEMEKKLDDLGVHLDNATKSMVDAISENSVLERLEAFKTKLNDTRTPFGRNAGEISNAQSYFGETLATKDPEHMRTYVTKYAELYSTGEYGLNSNGEIKKVPSTAVLDPYEKICGLGRDIVSANFNDDNVFRVLTNYESLKEFFNTQTFATREAFDEYVISQYSVWASDMTTAILFDYFRVMGQIDNIKESEPWKNEGEATFKISHPLTHELYTNLILDARIDLMRLGFDTKGDSVKSPQTQSYDLNEFVKNNWIDKYHNTSVYVDSSGDYILGANVNAVNYAYATEVENKPVKTVVGTDPAYQEKLATAKQKAADADAEENRTHYAHPFHFMDWDKAREAQKDAREALDQLIASGGNVYADKVLKDEKGVPLPGKLKAEEKTSNDGKILYSYRNNKWVYNRLDQQTEYNSYFKSYNTNNMDIPACTFAKNMVNAFARKQIEDMSGKWLATCWDQNGFVDSSGFLDGVIDHVMLKEDTDILNTAAASRHRGGINSLLKNTITRTVNGVKMIGFEGNSDRLAARNDFKLDGESYGTLATPTYNIGLGEYKNDQHINPTNDTKTIYQNFDWNTTSSNPANHEVGYHGDPVCDRKGVNFIKVANNGDALLSGLNNGNKLPSAPDHFIQ